METYFLSESQIQLWLDQLIEQIIAVTQANETETENTLEFEKGKKLVEEITALLTNISSLPPSSVFDPIIHLIDQRLQGQKIVDLTNFNKVMEAIVKAGIAVASGELNIEPQAIPAFAASTNQNLTENLQPTPTFTEIPLIKNDEESDINSSESKPQQNFESQLNSKKEVPPAGNCKDSSIIPQEATCLAFVIKQIFPKSKVRWNFCLGEYNFLAQVENLLIYQENLNEGEVIQKEMKKEGWNTIVCRKEDLSFPRRFEREINRRLRNSNI